MDEYVFSHSVKKLLIKYLRFVSKNIILHENKYYLNIQLETFNPYASDTQPVQQRLGEIVHALGYSVRHPRRPARGQAVQSTCEDIFLVTSMGYLILLTWSWRESKEASFSSWYTRLWWKLWTTLILDHWRLNS